MLSDFEDFLLEFWSPWRPLPQCGRVNAAVGHQLVKDNRAPAHRVKATQDDGFRRIVHNEFNASRCFEGADVAALPADDAALDIVVLLKTETEFSTLCSVATRWMVWMTIFLASWLAFCFASSRMS